MNEASIYGDTAGVAFWGAVRFYGPATRTDEPEYSRDRPAAASIGQEMLLHVDVDPAKSFNPH